MDTLATPNRVGPSDRATMSEGEQRARHPFWLCPSNSMVHPWDRAKLIEPLATFAPIELSQMNRVSLLSRYEVKYVMHSQTLLHLLAQLADGYQVLEVAGQRLNRYRTLYFDTADLALYHRHHAGVRNRYKVRAREYVESQGTFLEVKHKTNKDRTIKSRIQTNQLVTGLNQSNAQFLQDKCPYAAAELQPCLWNDYSRITLVNRAHAERITLDIDLTFAQGEQRIGLPGIVVAEVKQADSAYRSAFTQLMRENHVARNSFSKYCIGVSLLYPQVKHNNFKATHRLMRKLMAAS